MTAGCWKPLITENLALGARSPSSLDRTPRKGKPSIGIANDNDDDTMATYQNGVPPARAMDDDSDVEEEALVNDYKEQVQYEDGDELSQTNSINMADDIQSRLVQAAQPLDFSAPLEVKFQSYDAYCSLFHYILNSEGPVDLEPPSVSPNRQPRSRKMVQSRG